MAVLGDASLNADVEYRSDGEMAAADGGSKSDDDIPDLADYTGPKVEQVHLVSSPLLPGAPCSWTDLIWNCRTSAGRLAN